MRYGEWRAASVGDLQPSPYSRNPSSLQRSRESRLVPRSKKKGFWHTNVGNHLIHEKVCNSDCLLVWHREYHGPLGEKILEYGCHIQFLVGPLYPHPSFGMLAPLVWVKGG